LAGEIHTCPFDDIFDGSYNWTISLAKTPLGNASSSETESF